MSSIGGKGSLSYRSWNSDTKVNENNARAGMYWTAAGTQRVDAPGIDGAYSRAVDARKAYLDDVRRRQALGSQMGQMQGQQDRVIGYLSGVANGANGQGFQAFQREQAEAAGMRTRAAMANRTAGAAAMRAAQYANDQASAQGVAQGMAVRAQEQDMAQQQLAAYLAQARGAASDVAQLESDRAASYRAAAQQGDMYRARTEQALALQNQSYYDTSRDRVGDLLMQHYQGMKGRNDRVREERNTRGVRAAGTVMNLAGEIL